jgi:hypothetical protein
MGYRACSAALFAARPRRPWSLTLNDFADLDTLEQHLLAFGRRYEQIASPFEWKFTATNLNQLLTRTHSSRRARRVASAVIRCRTSEAAHSKGSGSSGRDAFPPARSRGCGSPRGRIRQTARMRCIGLGAVVSVGLLAGCGGGGVARRAMRPHSGRRAFE